MENGSQGDSGLQAHQDRYRDAMVAVLELLRQYVTADKLVEFEQGLASIGEEQSARFLSDPRPVRLIWQDNVLESFAFCCKWVHGDTINTRSAFNVYENVLDQLVGIFESVGGDLTGDKDTLSALLAIRRLHWRTSALVSLRQTEVATEQPPSITQAPTAPAGNPRDFINAAVEKHYRNFDGLRAKASRLRPSADVARTTLYTLRNGKNVKNLEIREAIAAAIREAGIPCTADDLIWREPPDPNLERK